jgi:hypothetical protein
MNTGMYGAKCRVLFQRACTTMAERGSRANVSVRNWCAGFYRLRRCQLWQSLYTNNENTMEPESISFIRRQIHAAKGIPLEISAAHLRSVISESQEFLAEHPLDLLYADFDRDKERLEKRLDCKFEQISSGAYIIHPQSKYQGA